MHGAAVSPFLPMQWRAELSPKAHLYCLLKFNASLKDRDLHMTRPFSREPRLKTSLRRTQDTASNYHHLWLCAFVWKFPIVLTSSPLVTPNLYYATNLHQCSWQLRCFKLPWARDQWNFLSWQDSGRSVTDAKIQERNTPSPTITNLEHILKHHWSQCS